MYIFDRTSKRTIVSVPVAKEIALALGRKAAQLGIYYVSTLSQYTLL